MKTILMLMMMCIAFAGNAQIKMTEQLSNELQSKVKFQDIKNTVLDHYNAQLSKLSDKDSIERKTILRQLKMWNRRFWMSEYYTNADGTLADANKLNYDAYQNEKNIKSKVINGSQTSNWNLQGPINSEKGIGRIDKIAFHPTNANTIFAGSPFGGLFKTLDGGNNWFPISEFLPSLGISGIAIDNSNPNLIYVLTGDANSSGGCFNGNVCFNIGEHVSVSQGVFKSYDGGSSWQKTGLLSPYIYGGRELIINPTNSQILCAATSSGIYRSNNGGDSWVLSTGTSNLNIWDIKFKPGDPNTVYASGNETFLKSSDGGITFTNVVVNGLPGANRISIGVTPASPTKVLLFCGPMIGNSNFKGLFQSNNSGQNFTLLANSPNLFSTQIGNDVYNDQSIYDITIAISPTNANDIYVGGLTVWHSTNGGSAWNEASAYWPNDNPYMHPDIHHLAFNPLNNQLFCANDGGIYQYFGILWASKYNGLTTSQFYHFERKNDEDNIWGGTQDNGIIQQDGGGYYESYAFGDGYDVITDHPELVEDGDANDVYFTLNDKIKKDCFVGICDISVPNNTNYFGNLAMSPDDEDKIYVGYQTGLWRSSNAGDDWELIGAKPSNWCISASAYNDDVVYVAGATNSFDGKIQRYNSPNLWTDITPPAPYTGSLKITDIDVHRGNNNIVYISIAGTTANAKVFRTLNGGTNWENLTFNLPNVPIFSIKSDASDGIYVGTSIGMFYKRNNVNSWESFSNGLPPVPITEIELWPGGNGVEVWASTFGRGIWFTSQYEPSCVSNLNLSGYQAGVYKAEASNQIISTKNHGGGVGTDIKYAAGNRIVLQDGFRAGIGTKFKTYIQPCGEATNARQIDSPTNIKVPTDSSEQIPKF